MLELNKIYNMDCLEGMKSIDDNSIDMILCDLPYGTTACSWDTIIPFKPLWEQYERIIKDKSAIVLTSSQPFTSALIMSNIKHFKYCWVWNKKKAGNIFLAQYQPMKIHEDIVVFYKGLEEVKNSTENYKELREYFKEIFNKIGLNKKQIIERIGSCADHCFRFNSSQWSIPTENTYIKINQVFNIELKPFINIKSLYDLETDKINNFVYNPIKTSRDKVKKSKNYGTGEVMGGNGEKEDKLYEYVDKNPESIIEISNASQKGKIHPTQKPVALFEYLINTYTNEKNIILDNCMGSGTTAIACINTNRQYIGFELDNTYYNLACERVNKCLDGNMSVLV